MPYPSWLGYLFAAVMMAVGAYLLARLVAPDPASPRRHLDAAGGHVLMALAMVGMLVPRWNVLPVGLWEAVFAVTAVWFLARSARAIRLVATAHARHYPIHMVMACAMLYMYWLGMPVTSTSAPGGMGMSAMSGASSAGGGPGLTLVLVVVLLASAVWQLDGIERAAPARQAALAAAGGPGAAAAGGGSSAPGRAEARRAERPWPATRPEVGCHVAMCLAMAYMLVVMV